MPVSFLSKEPEIEDYWRSIVLFGRNVASYKFALAASLLELRPESGALVKLTDLAPVFSKNIARHLAQADKQTTAGSSSFLDGCRKFNAGEITQDQLIDTTVRQGFKNVIDAFHFVGSAEVPQRFYIDERKSNSGIRITDEFSQLLHRQQAQNLPDEVEGRWRLVETAWELGISRSLVSIGYDEGSESLIALDSQRRRKSVVGSRAALNGYQKGCCFYCFAGISISDGECEDYPEVDHFFPHVLKGLGFSLLIDGVWNLVLACRDCNRGQGGKFASVPSIRLLERLSRRNEYLISSHHPLRETLMQQTGATLADRRHFLNEFHSSAWAALIHTWEPEERADARF